MNNDITRILSDLEIIPKKSKGQNFLMDKSVVSLMVDAAELSKDDLVVEVGPGLGILSERILNRTENLLMIELDKKICDYLRKNFHEVDLIEGDVLSGEVHSSMAEWIRNKKGEKSLAELDGYYKLIANLPYQITSKVIRQFFDSHPKPSLAVLMVQKEVALRITAKPGQMNLLALAVQVYGRPEIIKNVPANSFYPRPEVDSAVFICDLTRPNPRYSDFSADQQKLFWQIARLGFGSKRKQLKNNLKTNVKEIEQILEKIGIDSKVRAQELSVEQWCELVLKIKSR